MEKTQKFAAYFTEDQKDKIDRCQDLDGRRGTFEDRISKLLFKLAVARRRSADTCATSAPASMRNSSRMTVLRHASRSSSSQNSQQIFPV